MKRITIMIKLWLGMTIVKKGSQFLICDKINQKITEKVSSVENPEVMVTAQNEIGVGTFLRYITTEKLSIPERQQKISKLMFVSEGKYGNRSINVPLFVLHVFFEGCDVSDYEEISIF